MTDPVPSNAVSILALATGLKKIKARVEGAYDGTWMMHSEAVAVLAEIARLREDLARTESAHAVVMAENRHYKQRVAELEAVTEPWEAPGCDCPGIRKQDTSAHAPNCPYRVIREIDRASQPPRAE